MKPNLIVMVGLQGSGKSTYAKEHYKDYKILSSDEIREQMYGSKPYEEIDNNKVFDKLYMVMQSYLLTFNNVVIDATNMTRKSRAGIFERLRNIDCKVTAVVMATPFGVCITRNNSRDRKVPEEAIERFYKSFQVPCLWEGFDEVEFVPHYDYQKGAMWYEVYCNRIENYDQNSPYHLLTLDKHMEKCHEELKGNLPELKLAASWHDIGKISTRETTIQKGHSTYYGHENTGTYMIMCLKEYITKEFIREDKFLDVLFYINYHMQPYSIREEKTRTKYTKLFGEELFNNLMTLHHADKSAH